MKRLPMTLLGFVLLSSSIAISSDLYNPAVSCQYNRNELLKLELSRPQGDHYNNDLNANDWACTEAKSHLKGDSLQSCTPDPTLVDTLKLQSPLQINGTMTYKVAGIAFHRAYRYEIASSVNGKTLVTVKIHFTGVPLEDSIFAGNVQGVLDKAAEVWTKQSPGNKTEFRFLSVGANENPGFSVKLRWKKGILYDSFWDAKLFQNVDSYGLGQITHEIGHMLGVSDEYDPARGSLWQVKSSWDTRRCNIRGLMCDTYNMKAYSYYYYLILRRAVCDRNR